MNPGMINTGSRLSELKDRFERGGEETLVDDILSMGL
jgi:hypothetical protein